MEEVSFVHVGGVPCIYSLTHVGGVALAAQHDALVAFVHTASDQYPPRLRFSPYVSPSVFPL